MIRKSLDLALVCALALAALALTLLGVDHPAGRHAGLPLRMLFGLPLALVLPGYALMAALFPRRGLGSPDRALFTLSLSLATVILCGFVLNRTPWGLQPESWAVILSDVTLGGSLIAFARRHLSRSTSVAQAEQVPTTPAEHAPRSRLGLSAGQGLLFGLAIAVIAGALLLARGEAALRPAPDVVQLWMLPGNQDAPDTVRIGVSSVGVAGAYRLQIQRGGYIIREWPSLTLTPGQPWETTVTLEGRQPGSGAFEARLYRAEEPNIVYRRVALWLDTPQ